MRRRRSFYLQDRKEGNPWITRLPFPVHVVERVETIDHLTGNRFVSLYRYRHGYFDGEEREFRGFGYVEQTDTEAYAELAKGNLFAVGSNEEESSHVPPVQTRSWFHTGAFIDREHLSQLFAEEYYKGDAQAVLLPDTILPAGLSAQEEREACRALKGSVLRQEVYALDGTDEAEHPYTVTESNYEIRQVQPRQDGQYGVFFVHPRESLAYHYERHPEDPRVAHQMTLEVDGFGNGLKSAAIAYPRRHPAYPEQGQTFITHTENRVTNKSGEPDWYRIGLPIETCTYEITGLAATISPTFTPFTLEHIREQLATAEPLPYEVFARDGVEKRLMEQARTYYRPNDQADSLDPDRLPLGDVDSLALPGESFNLAFTPGLLHGILGEKLSPSDLATLLGDEGRYRQLEEGIDAPWWIPSGRQAFVPEQFYLPDRMQDPFGEDYIFEYDDYSLLVTRTEDPLKKEVTVVNNYRVMQPEKITDPNGNQAEVAFDTLGLVAGTAVMGKGEEPDEGDSLKRFNPDLDESQIKDFLTDPLGTAAGLLGTATTRIIYDLERYQHTGQPAVAATLARETHVSDLDAESDEVSKVQVSFLYSDGFGRELQTKIQAEPGDAPVRGDDGVLKCNENLKHTDPRWVGTGRTIYNNKGKPVKQYEPFFSPTHGYESEPGLVECGVTPILFYDPLERVVATLHPNKTYEKVVFDPWQQTTWDVNDTLTETTREDPTEDKDVGTYFKVLNAEEYLPTWYTRYSNGSAVERDAAKKAANHAGTPSVAHLDTLGRPFLTIAHNGWNDAGEAQLYETRVEQDIEGQSLAITDARNNPVMVNTLEAEGQRLRTYDLLGNGLYSHSSDAGERWMLNNLAGNPIRGWDSRGHTLRYTYDRLQRPVGLYVQGGDLTTEILAEATIYGEQVPNAAERNLRGQVYQVFDAAGVVTSVAYDFKGNLLRGHRRLAREYRQRMDWNQPELDLESLIEGVTKINIADLEGAIKPYLEASPQYSGRDAIATTEPEQFTTATTYDALNRPIEITSPDGSVTKPTYNEANLLEGMAVQKRGAAETTTLVTNIDYDAKGQRTQIEYGNGVSTTYTYDPDTFRLTKLLTLRDTTHRQRKLQDLQYTYDPAGNITRIRDEAQPEIYFRNQVVTAQSDYTYDALYQLIAATGREHLGQTAGGERQAPQPGSHTDVPRVNLAHPGNGQAMGRYRQEYVYDAVGNILEMVHRSTDAEHQGWRRCYQYAMDSNRLLSTGYGSEELACPEENRYGQGSVYAQKYRYDAHGNMATMPHLPKMQWDFEDQLMASAQQIYEDGTPETTYYVYDAGGQRVRKVTERSADEGKTPTRMKERIYLGGFEIYREYNGKGEKVVSERETLHGMDDQQQIALIETKTFEDKDGEILAAQKPLIRYQLGNHLGSAAVEVDNDGKVITYEEYYPYGNTAYQAVVNSIEVSLKRYRYTGKERDQESGLYYYGARYYAAWLGRWVSCDPLLLTDGANFYQYTRDNPIILIDISGTKSSIYGDKKINKENHEDSINDNFWKDNPNITFDKESKLFFYTDPNTNGTWIGHNGKWIAYIPMETTVIKGINLKKFSEELHSKSKTAQCLAGLATGGAAGAAPGGFMLGIVAEDLDFFDALPRSFRMCYGLGEMNAGIAQMLVGGVGEGIGFLLDASGPGAAIGIPINLASAALITEGVADIGVGGGIFLSAFSDEDSTVESQSSSASESLEAQNSSTSENNGSPSTKEEIPKSVRDPDYWTKRRKNFYEAGSLAEGDAKAIFDKVRAEKRAAGTEWGQHDTRHEAAKRILNLIERARKEGSVTEYIDKLKEIRNNYLRKKDVHPGGYRKGGRR
jgi:RHS repeat-associated protein